MSDDQQQDQPQPDRPAAPVAPAATARNPVVTTLYWLLFFIMAAGLLLSTACTLMFLVDGSSHELDLSGAALVIGGPAILIFGGLAYWLWRLAKR